MHRKRQGEGRLRNRGASAESARREMLGLPLEIGSRKGYNDTASWENASLGSQLAARDAPLAQHLKGLFGEKERIYQ